MPVPPAPPAAPAGSPPTLDYAARTRGQRPRFVTALLLCLPGLFCWYVFIALRLGERFQRDVLPLSRNSLGLVMVAWPLAVITAVISVIHYWRKPKLWYVVVCLTSNILGLAYTAWCAGVFIFLSLESPR